LPVEPSSIRPAWTKPASDKARRSNGPLVTLAAAPGFATLSVRRRCPSKNTGERWVVRPPIR